MRKTTEAVGQAFLQGRKKTVANTWTDGKNVYLFGNVIARKNSAGAIEVRNAGHGTITTRERLNGLARLVKSNVSFGQHKYDQVIYVNGERREWDGEWIQITPHD